MISSKYIKAARMFQLYLNVYFFNLMQWSMVKISKPLVLTIFTAVTTAFTLTLGDISNSGVKGRESDFSVQ